jgi:hypothetical protein
MRPIKRPLSLGRETIRQLASSTLSEVNGGIVIVTGRCPRPAPTQQHSCFDSCYNTECCLEIP